MVCSLCRWHGGSGRKVLCPPIVLSRSNEAGPEKGALGPLSRPPLRVSVYSGRYYLHSSRYSARIRKGMEPDTALHHPIFRTRRSRVLHQVDATES